MRDAEHLRAKARELYDEAKRAEYVDDGLLCVLGAIKLERDAEEREEMHARATEHVHSGEPAAKLVASA